MVTESMRNRLRAQGIEAPRGACDGGKSGTEVSAYPHPGCFRKSGKERTYATGSGVRAANKGLTERHFCASVQRRSSQRGTPP